MSPPDMAAPTRARRDPPAALGGVARPTSRLGRGPHRRSCHPAPPLAHRRRSTTTRPRPHPNPPTRRLLNSRAVPRHETRTPPRRPRLAHRPDPSTGELTRGNGRRTRRLTRKTWRVTCLVSNRSAPRVTRRSRLGFLVGALDRGRTHRGLPHQAGAPYRPEGARLAVLLDGHHHPVTGPASAPSCRRALVRRTRLERGGVPTGSQVAMKLPAAPEIYPALLGLVRIVCSRTMARSAVTSTETSSTRWRAIHNPRPDCWSGVGARGTGTVGLATPVLDLEDQLVPVVEARRTRP